MPREERKWHPQFCNYMKRIVNHPNYKDLWIETKSDGSYSWIATASSEVGKARITWCKEKAKELGFPIQAGVYADVMLAIHPTKWKVCQTCGNEMSLYYHYPNANFLKALNNTFNSCFTDCDHIHIIWNELAKNGTNEIEIARFLISKGELPLNPSAATKDEIINALELACRKGNKKCLGPGAMSNFPDRYDGFHTYNRCCRATQDKGRSKENLKSYTKDRRAYEYWSDGNIHAANQFMGSSFFKGTSADHIGPISLGFIHDPRYLQPMSSSDNSTKRDRLQYEDIEKIIETEVRTGISPMSWYSRLIWEHIRSNYQANPSKVAGYRDALKQHMANFMFILWTILDSCPENGEEFLAQAFLEPNYGHFNNSYNFNERGEIVDVKPRHFTDRNQSETDRYRRIAIEAVYDYNEKKNRHLDPNLSNSHMSQLCSICSDIASQGYSDTLKGRLMRLVEDIEQAVIRNI